MTQVIDAVVDHDSAGTAFALEPGTADLARGVATQIESFLIALRAIAASQDPGRAVPLLLLEVSQVLLAGARLGVHLDFEPVDEYEPDLNRETDLDDLRLALAELLAAVDQYTEVFDPYGVPTDCVPSVLSDDLTAIAADLDQGLRHYKAGQITEALWWWQYSYLASWGPEASSALRALQAVASHDRLDAAQPGEGELMAEVTQVLDGV